MAEVTFRSFSPADAEITSPLFINALRTVYPDIQDGEWTKDLKTVPQSYQADGGDFLMGEVDGKVIAEGGIHRVDEATAEMKRVAVSPDAQEGGIGQKLVEALESRARELGFTKMVLDTTLGQAAARHIYEKAGYELVERKMVDHPSGTPFDTFFYEKNLAPIFEQIQLRPWQGSDFDAAVTLNREAEEHIGIGSESGDWAKDMQGISETFEGSGGEFLVGQLDGKMVVMGGFKRLSDTTAEVKRMRVSPELQGQGIGPQLLELLEDRMRESGVKKSVVSTLSVQEAALKLYSRAGYTETGREELTEGPEKGFTVVSFEKSLA